MAVDQLRHAERLNVIGKLATGVAHELGTPLNVISGSIEMMNAEPSNRIKADAYAKTILEQTAKMTALIRHLLEFGRRGGSSRLPLDLNDVTTHAVDLFVPIAAKTGCRMIFEPSAITVTVVANGSEIEQVLSNLILNALQAMRAGGTLRLRTSVETRHGDPLLASRCKTTGWALMHATCRAYSILSSRPRGWARGPGSACRSATGSSRTTAVSSK
jgi:signal transduction histidine kinase